MTDKITFVRPANIPVTDDRYQAGRRTGLGRDLEAKQRRLDGIRKDVAKIRAEVEVGKLEVTEDVLAKLTRLAALECRILSDVNRLTGKIAQSVRS